MPQDAKLLLLDGPAVLAGLNPADVLTAVRDAFVLHSRRAGRVFPLIRERLHTGGIFGIKAGDVSAQNLLGFKAAGFWSSNPDLGGEPHQATVVLIDPQTGRPLCVMDGNAITTERTGAAGGLGLQLLARPESANLCLFGTGVQAKVQLEYALRVLPALSHVQYVSVDSEPSPVFESAFAGRCTIQLAKDRNKAVAESDVVITATPGGGALFDADALQPGTHVNCVGADTSGKRELPDGVLSKVRAFVDDAEQGRTIGEGQWAPGIEYTELGDLLDGVTAMRREPTDITIFDMTGMALQDLTVAKFLYEQALAEGRGNLIAWPW